MLVEPPLMQPYRFLDYWWREGDNMIMQPKKIDPISNSFRFIIYILQEGGGAVEPSLMQPCCFLDY